MEARITETDYYRKCWICGNTSSRDFVPDGICLFCRNNILFNEEDKSLNLLNDEEIIIENGICKILKKNINNSNETRKSGDNRKSQKREETKSDI